MKAVIYIRVSTKDQVKNLSLATQEEQCRKYCRSKGLEIARIFKDEGESAKTTDRPGLQGMLGFCKEFRSEIGYVVIYCMDRISRQTFDHFAILASLRALGIKLRSVTQPVDETALGEFLGTFFAGLSQLDNDVRAERTKAGMRASAERGDWNHIPPLGYLKEKCETKKGGRMVKDPKRAPLVLQAFEMFATGTFTRKQVLDRVNALGLRTKKGKKVSNQTLSRMLRNPIYAGWVKVKSWDFSQKGDWEPIVNQLLFDKVQLLLDGKRHLNTPRHRNNPKFPLRHFVRCAKCGTPMTGSSSKGRNRHFSYYHCRYKGCQ